jgi:hypothetical protein
MTTVKEFKDLGVEFIGGDCVQWRHGNMAGVNSFAWRPMSTLPDNPTFSYEMECSSCDSNAMWRPSLNQSKPAKPHDFAEHVSDASKLVFTQSDVDNLNYQLGMHKKNSGILFELTNFMVEHGIGRIGEGCVDVAIRELSEKHGIDTRTDKEKAIDEACLLLDSTELHNKNIDCSMAIKATIEAMVNLGYRK